MRMPHRLAASLLVVLAAAILLGAGPRMQINLDPPGDRDFIVDKAQMITPEDRAQIVKICDQLLTDTATPIIVVTVENIDKYADYPLPIEAFATMLFNQWGIGHPEVNNREWNTGILLVVSRGDRKARIELGAGWSRAYDQACRRIMDEQIIPRFKQGDFSGGIVAGVESLDRMTRGLRIPSPPRPWWHYALIAGFIGLAVFTVISLIRRGSSGWAWLFWGAVFAVVGVVLYQIITNAGRSSRGGFGGGGFSGGSFGGGFSGGGGATGSW